MLIGILSHHSSFFHLKHMQCIQCINASNTLNTFNSIIFLLEASNCIQECILQLRIEIRQHNHCLVFNRRIPQSDIHNHNLLLIPRSRSRTHQILQNLPLGPRTKTKTISIHLPRLVDTLFEEIPNMKRAKN